MDAVAVAPAAGALAIVVAVRTGPFGSGRAGPRRATLLPDGAAGGHPAAIPPARKWVMSSPPSTRGAAPARPRRSRSVVAVVVALGAILAIAVAAVVVELITDAKWTPPDFPSLAAEPDPSLQGTVAYFAGQSRCVRVVAASGQPEKEVLCVGDQVDSRTGTPFKEMGPQLVWLPDGRLGVTMFRLAPADSPSTATTQLPLVAGWRKIIDVRTGQVEDVPAADLPAEPAQLPAPTVNAAGERIDTVAAAGRTEVVLDDGSGSRTLLSFPAAPPQANYQFGPAFWAPNGDWIAAGDGRILVITTGDPAVTRVLRDDARAASLVSSPEFAVTEQNLLTPAG